MGNQWQVYEPMSSEVIEKRRYDVMMLRVKCWTWDRIAQEISQKYGRQLSATQCAEDCRIIMKQRLKELRESTDAFREMQVQRLMALLEKVAVKAEEGSIDHLEILIKIEIRLSKLMGTEAPTKHEVDDKRDEKKKLTDQQIRERVAAISERLTKKLEAPTIDAEVVSSEPRNVELIPRNDEPNGASEDKKGDTPESPGVPPSATSS